ncbi:MAG TPA: lamin tail domain-containing protein [Chitinophagaceae bacterium]|nr:lamin tail domain-containing protein [Chitinophagaceae bacterium]
MKKVFLLLVLSFSLLSSQAQIIINELQSDAGNYEGTGGDWIEFKNIGAFAQDMSCWLLTNGGSVKISIPTGLIVPSGGYLLVGNASKMMCSTCDYKSMNTFFTLNPDGYGDGTGIFSNTVFLNTDLVSNGGCGCLTGSGNYNNGAGLGDRVILFDAFGNVADAMMYAGGNNYGTGPINVTFPSSPTCGANFDTLFSTTDPIYFGRTICNDLTGCNSSYARLPDGNNGAIVTYDQSGNLGCTNCLLPCAALATNTASTDYPTPGLNNSLSANPWTATLNGNPITGTSTTLTVCGATPITFTYVINNFANASLVATQPSGNLGSYVITNGGTPSNFSGTNYNAATGVTTLASTFTAPNGTTQYEFVWGNGNTNCTSCPGSNSTATAGTSLSPQQECYITNSVTIIREDILGGTPTASCSLPGSVTVNGATGTNIQYTLQKQITIGGPFTTIAGPFTSNIIGGIFDDDADPALPNYRILVSSVNTVCANPTPLVVSVPNSCLGNPACPKYILTGTGAPTFTPSSGNPICANSNVQFSVDITGVCTTGQLEVWYDYNPSFDPYTSGTLLGTAPSTVGTTPPSVLATGRVFINEFVARPAQGTCTGTPDQINPNSGEWVELYNAGPGNVDISGWILADGDWTATIPAGTIINSGLHYLIGGGGTFCSSGVLPDLNIETCNCANVSPSSADIMNLTNNGEQIALFDCNGTFIDGVLWASGQALPDTTANIAPATGCGNYILQKSVNLPVAASFASSGTIPAPNSGKYRTSTNTWVTSTATTITPKAANPGGDWISSVTTPFGTQCPPPPVTSSITVTIPDTCSQTGPTSITLKAIYKPTPITPCLKSDVTASATYVIPQCDLATLSGDGEYCEPNTAPISINISNPLVGNYDFNLSNGTNTTSINAATGAGPFTTNISNSGVWTIASITPPTGLCPPKIEGDADIIINPIPVINSVPTNASFCAGYGFDLASLEPNIITTPPTSQFVWYDSAIGGSQILPYINPSVTKTYYVAATTGSPAFCEQTVRTPVTVTVNPIPEIPFLTANGITAQFFPQSPNCTPTPCPTGLEYSANGINWGAGPSFTFTDPGWSGFGSPTNSVVYVRNASVPACLLLVTYLDPMIPLPTELFNFYGKLNLENTVDLKWQTAQEKNVSRFEIERSNDNLNFKKIGEVNAKGNTSSISDYLFNDATAINEFNYYRLKIVDLDNQFAYSNIILVKLSNLGSRIVSLYPNPTKDNINIEISSEKNQSSQIQIFDALGKLIFEQPLLLEKGFQKHNLNLAQLAKGQYTLRIPLSNGSLIKSFVKE